MSPLQMDNPVLSGFCLPGYRDNEHQQMRMSSVNELKFAGLHRVAVGCFMQGNNKDISIFLIL
jgi:hypothetical protein